MKLPDMIFIKKNGVSISIICRVLIALLGGFLLANLVAILVSYIPSDNKVDAIVAGLMSSFIVYTAVVMYVFSSKTLRSSALGVFICCLVIFSINTYLDMVLTQ